MLTPTSITRVRAFVAFLFLNALLLLWVVPQLPPEPIYRTTAGHPEKPFIELEEGAPVSFSFVALAPRVNALLLQYLFTDGSEGSHLTVTIENETREVTLAESQLTFGDMKEISFSPNNRVGDRIRVTVAVGQSIKGENPDVVQALKRAFYSPKYPIDATIGGVPTDGSDLRPIFTVKYAQPVAWLLWLWPVVLIIAGWMGLSRWHDLEQRLLFYLILGLLLTTTSLLMFTGRIYQQWDFVDPDSYGDAAERFATWLGGDADEKIAASGWLREFPHAHAPLVPALLAIVYVSGIPHLLGYAFLVSTAAFGVILLTDWMAKLKLNLSARTSLLVVLFLATHLVFVKSFARPSTDMIGLIGIVGGLAAVHGRYQRRFSWKENLAFAVLLVAICFSRPPGIGYAFLIGVAALGADASRRHGLLAPGLLRHGIQIALPFLAIMAAFWFRFDWFHNFELNVEKSKEFHDRIGFATFWPVALTVLLPLVLALPFLFRRSKFPVHLHAAFVVLVVLMLWWVKAPWILRLLLPLLPSIALVVGSALAGRRPVAWPVFLTLIYAMIHLGLLCYEYQLILFPSAGIARFIYY